MIRRLLPLLMTLLATLIDTSILPVFYHGALTVPFTLVTVLCIALCHGRASGLLYGMIGGLLIDTSAGTLPIMTFYFMAEGFLLGLILVTETSDEEERMALLPRSRSIVWVFPVVLALTLGAELILLVYKAIFTYTYSMTFNGHSLRDMALRCGIIAALTALLNPFYYRLFTGQRNGRRGRSREEVRHF